MLLRRIAASLIMLLFILSATVMFGVAALSQTVLQTSFYQGKVMEKAYSAFIDIVTQRIYENDTLISTSFSKEYLQAELTNAFPQKNFEILTQELINNLSQTQNTAKPLTISLEPFRESIAQISPKLSNQIFQAIPICRLDEIPVEKNGIPSCINQDISLDIESMVEERLKKNLMESIPTQLSLDLSSTRSQEGGFLIYFFQSIGTLKYLLYVVLLTLLIAMALIIFKPFTEVVLYSGLAFGLSGIFGYLSGFFFESTAQIVLTKVSFLGEQPPIAEFVSTLLASVTTEMQKIALIFLAFGALLILIQAFVKKR